MKVYASWIDLLVAVIVGLLTGLGAAHGMTRATPEALGWYTFCAAIIGAGMARRRP